MSEFTAKMIKEARIKAGYTQDEAAELMKTNKRVISQTEANKRTISADELAQFSRIYNVDVRVRRVRVSVPGRVVMFVSMPSGSSPAPSD